MKHRMGVAAIAATALIAGACGERDGGSAPLFTEPGISGSAPAYITTTSASIVDPRTKQLRVVKPSELATAPGVSASIAAGGMGQGLQLANGAPGIAKSDGYYVEKFVDASKHQHALVLLYGHFGGPPAAVQHYVDNALVSTTTYAWQKTSTGWLRTASLTRAVQKGQLVGTYSTTTTTTTPTTPGKGGGGPAIPVRLERPAPRGLDRVLGRVAYALAFSLAPQDASAQASPAFGACAQEWLRFAAAAAIVIGLDFVIADMPAVTPLIMSQFAAALAQLGAAEDALLKCVLEHQPGTFQFFGGGAGPGGGAGGGVDNTCLEGSYAAHCTTPFTL
ncbi:MAG: hypothetical protein ABIQ10_13130 [Gemmatimonadaceae bacterium]